MYKSGSVECASAPFFSLRHKPIHTSSQTPPGYIDTYWVPAQLAVREYAVVDVSTGDARPLQMGLVEALAVQTLTPGSLRERGE